MADKKASKNKNIIVGVCSALIVIIVIVVIAVIIGANKKLDDSYFVSDGTKYVFSINYLADSDETEATEEETTNQPNKVHEVYTYSGDTITSLKHYYEYNDAAAAKAALDFIKSEYPEVNLTIDGKYLIEVADESEYSDYTASDIKEIIELYQESLNYEEVEE